VHSLVRRYIKTAFAFLVLGLAIGTRILIRREIFLRPPSLYEVSAHTHAILVGFVMMMILGVALLLRSAVVIGGLAQFAGIALFFFAMWPRIRSAGSHSREAKAEKF